MDTIRSKLRLSGPTFGGGFRSMAARIVDILLIWQERAAQRHALAALDERMLSDIGLSHADAFREASKPFWRA